MILRRLPNNAEAYGIGVLTWVLITYYGRYGFGVLTVFLDVVCWVLTAYCVDSVILKLLLYTRKSVELSGYLPHTPQGCGVGVRHQLVPVE